MNALSLQSVAQTHEHQRLSDKYRFIPTTEVMDVLASDKWLPIDAKEMKVRSDSRVGFQKHMLRFRQEGSQPVNGLFPEVVLTNSHDGSASFTFMAGLFRLVCSNGLIVSEGMFGSIRVKHVGFQRGEVMDAVGRVIEETPRLMGRVGEFNSIQLTDAERYVFAEAALNMKFQEMGQRPEGAGGYRTVPYQIGDRRFDLARLVNPVRSDDRPPTLWNTFNTVQEKLSKGAGFEDTVKIDAHGRRHHTSKVRGIKGIDESVRVNRELWGLMEKMAELKR